MMTCEELRPGQQIRLEVMSGMVDPFTQVRVQARRRYDIDIVGVGGGSVKIKTEGCFPVDGFRISAEMWEHLFAPVAGCCDPCQGGHRP